MLIGQIEILTKLVENGIIAAAFLYILHWLLNKQSKEAAEHSKQSQLTSLEVASAIRGLVNAVTAMQQQLLTHDLTMSGLNPDSGASFEDRDSLALKKYNDVMLALEEQREILRTLNQEADVRMSVMRSA
jgi:hypothetical protein